MHYRGAATGVQAETLGRVLQDVSYRLPQSFQNTIIGYLRRVSLVCAAGESQNRAMLGQFPGTDTGLHEPVDGWGVVDQVGHPSVPV